MSKNVFLKDLTSCRQRGMLLSASVCLENRTWLSLSLSTPGLLPGKDWRKFSLLNRLEAALETAALLESVSVGDSLQLLPATSLPLLATPAVINIPFLRVYTKNTQNFSTLKNVLSILCISLASQHIRRERFVETCRTVG